MGGNEKDDYEVRRPLRRTSLHAAKLGVGEQNIEKYEEAGGAVDLVPGRASRSGSKIKKKTPIHTQY